MPNIYSKYHPFIFPPCEKIFKWYEGLDSSDSSSDELENHPSYIRFLQQFRFFYYNWHQNWVCVDALSSVYHEPMP